MLGLYLHIPFCLSKCSYCDFNSYGGKQEWFTAYVDALVREIGTIEKSEFSTIFIGGGTPTILTFSQLSKIVDAIYKYHSLSKDCEFTIEANPETIKGNMGLFDLGINRISMGLQTHDDSLLKLIGRCHTFKTFKRAFYDLRQEGFKNINVDIMYGLPNQTGDIFLKTLEEVLKLDPEHISAYELNLSEDCKMFKSIQKGEYALPLEDEVIKMTEHLCRHLGEYNRYEISNYAKKGYECRHNLNYWKNGFYYGCGAGAHGCIAESGKVIRYENTLGIEDYINGKKCTSYIIDKNNQMFETVMVGLRMIKGVSLFEFKKRFNVDLLDLLLEYIENNQHLIKQDKGYIFLTKRGLDIQNVVLRDIMEIMV